MQEQEIIDGNNAEFMGAKWEESFDYAIDWLNRKAIAAPTIADVVMWLYKEHGIWVQSNISRYGIFYSNILKKEATKSLDNPISWEMQVQLNDFNSPREAYLAAIEYCINELEKPKKEIKLIDMKLIKLSDTHYIVVDDSEINEGDWCLKWSGGKWNICFMDRFNFKLQKELWNETVYKKITHSTQPESLGTDWMQSVKPLLLSEIEKLVYGYSVEDFIDEFEFDTLFKTLPEGKSPEGNPRDTISKKSIAKEAFKYYSIGVKKGFKAHRELVKEKCEVWTINKEHIQNYIQSLLPKTEWECTINEHGKIELV